MERIYFDTAAGTSANPSSLHKEGLAAAALLKKARQQVGEILGANAREIIFTSGGTEGNNLAIFGVIWAVKLALRKKVHIITLDIEHPSVLEPCRALEREGVLVTYLSARPDGLVDIKEFKKVLRPETFLVSIAYANNEIGTIQPIREIAKIIRHWRREQGTSYPYFHTDACQAPRFLKLNTKRLGVDLMTLNGAKIYGPRGSGCLFVRGGIAIESLFYGGGQEGGRRSGTENAAAAVGFARALRICEAECEKESRCLSALRDHFIRDLRKIKGAKINGSLKDRLPNNISVSFGDLEAEQIVIELDARGVACSAGSACGSRSNSGGHTRVIIDAVRFSLGREATKSEVDYVLKVLAVVVKKLSATI